MPGTSTTATSLPESAPSSNLDSGGSNPRALDRFVSRMGSVLFVLLCVEIGFFLLILPWSGVWDKSFFLNRYPAARTLLLSSFLRGAISGLGVANLGLGIAQAWRLRRTAAEKSSEISQPSQSS